MWDWLKKRLAEPSTAVGLTVAIAGVGQLAKIDEAPAIAEAVGAAAQVAGAGDYTGGAVLLIGGLLGAFLGEKGKR